MWKRNTHEKPASKSFRLPEWPPGMPCGLGPGALHAADAEDATPPGSGPRVPEELLGSPAVFEELYLEAKKGNIADWDPP